MPQTSKQARGTMKALGTDLNPRLEAATLPQSSLLMRPHPRRLLHSSGHRGNFEPLTRDICLRDTFSVAEVITRRSLMVGAKFESVGSCEVYGRGTGKRRVSSVSAVWKPLSAQRCQDPTMLAPWLERFDFGRDAHRTRTMLAECLLVPERHFDASSNTN